MKFTHDLTVCMHRRTHIATGALLLSSALLFTSCGTKKTTTNTPPPAAASSSSGPSLPTAPLGLYTSYYLGGGGILPSMTAVTGIEAQVKLHTPFNPMASSDTYALLQEFGNVLQIDIPDLLNRSDDRPTTLTEYTNALSNITQRAKNMVTDLQTHQKQAQDDQRTKQAAVSDLQKRNNDAFHTGDFATAGSLQQELTDAQAALTKTQADVQQTQNTLRTYQQLITVADQRLQAIEKNREILIAGLKVVDVPGIQSLGIVQDHSSSYSPFGTP